jgi:hypothetical protein
LHKNTHIINIKNTVLYTEIDTKGTRNGIKDIRHCIFSNIRLMSLTTRREEHGQRDGKREKTKK